MQQGQQPRPTLPTSLSSSLLSTKRSADEVEQEQRPMFQEHIRSRILAPVPKRRLTETEGSVGQADEGMAMEDAFAGTDQVHAFDPALAQHQFELQQQQFQLQQQQQSQPFASQFGQTSASANPFEQASHQNGTTSQSKPNGLTISPFTFPSTSNLGTSSSLNSPAVSTFSSIAPSTTNNDADSFLFDEQDDPPLVPDSEQRNGHSDEEMAGSGAAGGYGNGSGERVVIRRKGMYNGYDGGMGSDDEDDEIDWSARYTGKSECGGGYACNHGYGHA